MLHSFTTDRQYRTHEALSLASLLVALAVTNLLWGLAVVEYNPLVGWALGVTSWTAVAIGALAITAGAFSLLRWADRRYGTLWFDRLAVVIGAVSLANAANDLWILYQHGVPATMWDQYMTFIAGITLASGLLLTRYELVAAIQRVPTVVSRKQARALGLVAIMALSMPAMFAVSFGTAGTAGTASAQTESGWSEQQQINDIITNKITAASYSPGNNYLAIGDVDGNFHIFDTGDYSNSITTINNASNRISDFAWTEDYLLVGVENGGTKAMSYNRGTWTFQSEFVHSGEITHVSASPDGSKAVIRSGGGSRNAYIVSTAGMNQEEVLNSPSGGNGAGWEGDTIVIGDTTEVRVYDSSYSIVKNITISNTGTDTADLDLGPDEDTVAVSLGSSEIDIMSVESGSVESTYGSEFSQYLNDIEVGPASEFVSLAGTGADNKHIVRDLSDGSIVLSKGESYEIGATSFKSDGSSMAYLTAHCCDTDANNLNEHSTTIQVPSITVKVSDQAGEPIEGASVDIEPETASSDSTTTDLNGKASFTFDQEQSVDITAETAIDSKSITKTATKDGTAVTIELTPGDIQVVDQDGNPVSGATVIATGPINNTLDADISDAQALRQEAENLLDEISGEDLEPESWNPDRTADDIVSLAKNTGGSDLYAMAHTPGQWESAASNKPGPELSVPQIRADQSDIMLSVWDPNKDPGGIVGTDPVAAGLPGKSVQKSITIEQRAPDGEVLQTETLETSNVADSLAWWSFDSSTHYAVRTYLPKGHYYTIYPSESDAQSGQYTIAVGDPQEFTQAWVEDIEDEAGNLIDRAERIETLLNESTSGPDLWEERGVTDQNGAVSFGGFPDDVEVADVRAFKGPGIEELVEANQTSGIDLNETSVANLTLQDIRELTDEGIYEGDIFLAEPERIDSFPATIEGERRGAIPYEGIRDGNETIDRIRDILNETRDDIDEYLNNLDELIALRDRLINMTKDLPGFQKHFAEEYPEYATNSSEFDFSEPETVPEATAQVDALRDAIQTFDGVDGGDIDEEVGDIQDSFTKVINVPDRVRSLDFINSVEISYEDSPTQTIDNEFLSIERRALSPKTETDSGDGSPTTVLVIEDYEPTSSDIEDISVSFTNPFDDINSTVGTITSTLTTDIDVPSEVQQISDVLNVTIAYNTTKTESVPKENQTLFTDNDTLRIDSHPVDSSLTVENVVVEFADFSQEVDNVTFIGDDPGSDQAFLNTTVEVEEPPSEVNIVTKKNLSSGQYVLLAFEEPPENVYGNDNFIKYDHIYAPYINVADEDSNSNAELNIQYPIPANRDPGNITGLEFRQLTPVNSGDAEEVDDGDLVDNGTSNRYLNTTLALDNDYASISDVTPVRIHYDVSETEKIPERYLSLNATSNELTIDMYEVGSKRIQYIEVTGNNSNTEIINDTQDVTELNESLQGRIKLDASPASVQDVEAVAYWQNGDVEEIPNAYLKLEPAIGTLEVGSGDPGSYLLVDGYPTLGRELDRIDVSVGETNASVTPIEGGQFLNAEVSFEDGLFSFNDISEEDVTILAEWQDGETTRIPQQYWEVDGELTGVGKILINDYPIPEDKVAGNVEVIARAGEEIYRVSDRVESPTYGGESADVEYVAINNLEPATGKVVSLQTGLKDDLQSVNLTDATVVSPTGNNMDVTINNDGSVTFPTGDGPGTYRVDLVFADTSEAGDIEFQRSVPVEATNEPQNHPPAVHEMSGGDQSFAFVGALEAGSIKKDPVDETTIMTAVIERGADPPSAVHFHPSSEGVGSGESYTLQVRQGEDEQTVRSHVSTVVHVPLGDDSLVYREGNKPLTIDGTSYGELTKDDGVIRTYTTDEGEVSVRVIQDPGIIDRALFAGRTVFYDFSLPLGVLRFGVLTLLSLLLLTRRRVGEVVRTWI